VKNPNFTFMKHFISRIDSILRNIYDLSFTSTFGSNFDDTFDVIATLYCLENDKQWTPSNVVSHDVAFPMTYIFSLLRCFIQTRVISDLTIQTPYIHRNTDVLEVARATSWRWQERHVGGGKRDILEVERETSWRWKE
jgi:hypothetical protein